MLGIRATVLLVKEVDGGPLRLSSVDDFLCAVSV